jgi:RimJ/RimL family protein N-acetyltransferase
MDIKFKKLIEPTDEIAEYFSRWENDPALIPFIRPNRDQQALEATEILTSKELEKRLEHNHVYLIYLDSRLIGEMDFQIDPKHLLRKEAVTAWIGIIIGEETARGKGIGKIALDYLESEIKQQGLKRIELGVFEFNTNAIKLYQKAGYREIGRIADFTYWQGRMWQDIRMEKYVQRDTSNEPSIPSPTP